MPSSLPPGPATSRPSSRCWIRTSCSASTAAGSGRKPARRSLGAPAVAERLLARGARFAPHARPAIVNGTAGLIVPADVGLRAVVGLTVVGGKVTAIDLITDREKLRRLRLS